MYGLHLYRKKVLKALSVKLYLKYGEGWSYSNLRQIRQFYLAYANLTDSVYQIQFDLSWSHYLILMRIENHDERNFYEIEAKQQNWSVRELNRQAYPSRPQTDAAPCARPIRQHRLSQ